MQLLVRWDFGAQARDGSELAVTLDYLRALIRWYEQQAQHHRSNAK